MVPSSTTPQRNTVTSMTTTTVTTPIDTPSSSTTKSGRTGTSKSGNSPTVAITPTNNDDAGIPVWERLYKAETALTASMKKGAQSGECQDKIFSFSGGNSSSKRAKDKADSSLSLDRHQDAATSPHNKTPQNSTPSLRSTVRANRASTNSPNGTTTTTPVHERLHQSGTYSSIKQHERTPKTSSTVTPKSSQRKPTKTSPGNKNEPAYLRLNRLGTETLRKTVTPPHK
mmetsp:Transcript_25298/g.38957  ORF Transcript_25298/g.38957 Transcript_25298/m.38957 type:complete len:228 (-) Transcript_25298:447-1130(-)|eukprot:CAMPEP_0195302516 /NCGR_PEP_ID=MMETSP0707-20130614/31226_1 /TAXON_ID=33640 /ORGANISM="Asterionellopsis glacialis, Strain CCMP134" /LENGTH=227 /DNA_ID=CAMNT_0040365793 /DNA_START=192 /DNA_END=875 /DNA_ORIENTATION=-